MDIEFALRTVSVDHFHVIVKVTLAGFAFFIFKKERRQLYTNMEKLKKRKEKKNLHKDKTKQIQYVKSKIKKKTNPKMKLNKHS